MKDPKAHDWILIVAFLAMVGGMSLAQAVVDLTNGESVQFMELFEDPPSAKELRKFENNLSSHSWFADAVRPLVATGRYWLFDDVGTKAVLGRDGWWFFRTGVQFMVDRPVDDPEKGIGVPSAVSAIVDFRDQLALRGIELLVVPVPGKASVYPDQLTTRVDGPIRAEGTEALLAALEAEGVPTVDLFAAFKHYRQGKSDPARLLYQPRDTHWTPLGAELAAGIVAERVQEFGFAPKVQRNYEIRQVQATHQGDVLEMMELPWVEQGYDPIAWECRQVLDAETGQPFISSDASEILLLGDSFLNIYELDQPGSAGFLAHLARELARPLTYIVNDGGASTLVRQRLQRNADKLQGKRLVIWEFVERDIRFGLQGWQHVAILTEASP